MLLWLTFLLAVGLATSWLFPDTEAGKFLHALLVAGPAERLSRLRPRHLILAALVIGVLPFLAPALPMDMALFAVGDAAAYLEIVASLLALAAALRSRQVRVVGRDMAKRIWASVRRTISRDAP